MKLSSNIIALALCAVAEATPTPTYLTVEEKRGHEVVKHSAAISEQATLGYATLNGGTSGGSGGTVTTVSSLPQFSAAVAENNTAPAIVVVQGVISGDAKVRIGSNKTIVGLPGAGFNGVGLYFKKQHNLILRNIISAFVKAGNGDGLTIENSTNVWVDHCEFHSSLTQDKDFYDGLVDVTHGSDFVTISHTSFHDHHKTSLVGHSDKNGPQDTGHLHVTYANNHWKNCGSRGPSLRFGTGHIFNSLYQNMSSAINTRMGAQVLIESTVFKNVTSPIMSKDSPQVGYARAIDNDLGGRKNSAPAGTLSAASIPYNYTLLGTYNVTSTVPGQAGAVLTF
ncbi:pectate lyase B [Apodospora peruviana]|uniref:Pectate lyase B n=1 Tax=Apodospora peruviana TaxID=516989 RepID=A0AAE0M4Y7_9PEZI|nr:pectate lyase B [Apodospora peruviana]